MVDGQTELSVSETNPVARETAVHADRLSMLQEFKGVFEGGQLIEDHLLLDEVDGLHLP